MNVSPTQRLVSYLREFPPARPTEAAPGARAADRPTAASEPRAATPAQPAATMRPAAAPLAPPPAGEAPRRLLPRGSLVNILT